jgi:hypothetical protein
MKLQQLKICIYRHPQISYTFISHLQKTGNKIVYLFYNYESATYTMESKLYNANSKMLHGNMQRCKIIKITCRKF